MTHFDQDNQGVWARYSVLGTGKIDIWFEKNKRSRLESLEVYSLIKDWVEKTHRNYITKEQRLELIRLLSEKT